MGGTIVFLTMVFGKNKGKEANFITGAQAGWFKKAIVLGISFFLNNFAQVGFLNHLFFLKELFYQHFTLRESDNDENVLYRQF